MKKKYNTEEERKEAHRIASLKYANKNKDKQAVILKKFIKNNPEYKKNYNEKNKIKIQENKKQYNIKNYDKNKKDKQLWYQKNKERVKEKVKTYRLINKEYSKIYRENNKAKTKENKKKWDSDNKVIIKIKNGVYIKNRCAKDPLYKLSRNIRSLISSSIKQKFYKKKSKTQDILGCSFVNFKLHLEQQWSLPNNLDDNGLVWMNWDNYGHWDGIPKKLNMSWDIGKSVV